MTDTHKAGNGDLLEPSDTFLHRHLGPREGDVALMLEQIGCASLEALIDETQPDTNPLAEPMRLALSGKKDTIVARDYRGEKTLAAFEPIESLNVYCVVYEPNSTESVQQLL